MGTYFRKSRDAAITWSEESIPINETYEDLKNITGSLGLKKLYVVWYDDAQQRVRKQNGSLTAPAPGAPTEVVTGVASDIGVNNAIVTAPCRETGPKPTPASIGASQRRHKRLRLAEHQSARFRGGGGRPLHDPVDGVIRATAYFFRCFATNEHSGVWADNTGTFTTVAETEKDITIDATANSGLYQFSAGPSVVFTGDQIGYLVYLDAGDEVVYVKTGDGGATWTAAANIGSLRIESDGQVPSGRLNGPRRRHGNGDLRSGRRADG